MEKINLLRMIGRGAELLSFLVGVFYFNKLPKQWKAFVIYLGLIVIIESIGWYLYEKKLYELNADLYRFIGLPLQFIFFFWLYTKLLKFKYQELVFGLTSLIYIISWALEYFFLSKDHTSWLPISFTIGNLVLLVFLLIYFYRLVYSEQILTFYKQRGFWISVGVLCYYLGSFPFYGFINLLYTKYQSIFFIYYQVVILVSTSMYLLFIASFIWGEEE